MKQRIAVGDISLSVLDEGEGEAVLLLHGFPDSAALWRHQIPALVGAGYRVIAPDLRGFGDSDKPADARAYRIALIVADMAALLDTLGVERVRVVGHDWGAAVAWAFTAFHGARVERLAALAVGHPSAFAAEFTLRQRMRSWYMLLFQFAGVAEELLSRDDWRLFREFMHGTVDLERYIADLSRPGALTAALNWYRANANPARELDAPRAVPPITTPTLGMWASHDFALLEEQMRRSGEFLAGPWRYERLEGLGHWMQLDAPERVNELLLDFLR
jgi:pimeloyl-ACP methyl ester carboxylesterase